MEPRERKQQTEAEVERIHFTDRSPVEKAVLYTTEWELHDDCLCQMGTDDKVPFQSKNEGEVAEKDRPIKVS